MLDELEIKLLRKEIELRFSVDEKTIEKLYYVSREVFKQLANWLYWNKSLTLSDIRKITGRNVSKTILGRRYIEFLEKPDNYSIWQVYS